MTGREHGPVGQIADGKFDARLAPCLSTLADELSEDRLGVPIGPGPRVVSAHLSRDRLVALAKQRPAGRARLGDAVPRPGPPRTPLRLRPPSRRVRVTRRRSAWTPHAPPWTPRSPSRAGDRARGDLARARRSSSCARWNSGVGMSQTAREGSAMPDETTEGERVEPSATMSGETGSCRRSSTTIGPRSACRDSSSISAGVASSHRCAGVIASQRCAAGLSSRSARSRCAHVRVSALYQRRPCRRARRVAIVVLPEPGGPPIQSTCLSGSAIGARPCGSCPRSRLRSSSGRAASAGRRFDRSRQRCCARRDLGGGSRASGDRRRR